MDSKQKKQVVFAVLVLVIAAVIVSMAASVLVFADTVLAILPWLFLLGLLAFLASKFNVLILLQEYERGAVMRFGKFSRVTGPGWFFMIPGIESFRKVDLRVETIDTPIQDVITKDKIEVKIDAVVYMRVNEAKDDVVKSVFKVRDYRKAAQMFVASTLRDVAGDMTLSELIVNVEELNELLASKLQVVSKDWGVMIDVAKIKDIRVPDTVMNAMHEEKAAEQRKLARMEEALAHKAEIEAVKDAASSLNEKTLSYYYIRALEKMSDGKATKIIFPVELSRLAGFISGRLPPESKAESKDDADEDIGSLILKHRDKIEKAFGKKLANSLAKAVLEDKGKATVKALA